MKSENATKQDIDNLRTSNREDVDNLRISNKEDIENLKISTKEDIKNLENKMDNMFEKLTTVILKAVNVVSEKSKQESHENNLRLIEIERDRYSVLFEMNADHEAKIKNIDKRVQVLELA